MEFGFEGVFFYIQELDEVCFNPCFYGIWIRRLKELYEAIFGQSFNPCFYGIWIRSIAISLSSSSIAPVSILVFMEFGFEVLYVAWPSAVLYSFQSLFLWNLDSKNPGICDTGICSTVSILVFMEFGFEVLAIVFLNLYI